MSSYINKYGKIHYGKTTGRIFNEKVEFKTTEGSYIYVKKGEVKKR